MSSSDLLRRASPAAIVLTACAVRLEADRSAPPPAPSPPVVPTCSLLRGTDSSISRVHGRAHSFAGDGVERRWVVATAAAAGTPPLANATTLVGPLDGACGGRGHDATLAAAMEGVGPDDQVDLLSTVEAVSGAWAYFARTSGGVVVGRGVARFDRAKGRFIAGERLLWTGDRPSFGVAAASVEATTYVYGCKQGRGFASDCFVARAPGDHLDDEAAYEYATGGGNWSARVDDAWPVFEASETVSVVWLPRRGRWVMAHAEPLGRDVMVRTGLGPDGPWSAAVAAARCWLPDAQAFCAAVSLHPALADVGRDGVPFTYAPVTFTEGAAERDPLAYWTRLGVLPVPPALP
jgi:hypothetical protein